MDALQHIFFIGLQEEFQLSSELLLREIGMTEKLPQPEIKKERDQSNGEIARQKADIKNNAALMKRAREVNQYDLKLYEIGEFVFFPYNSSLVLAVVNFEEYATMGVTCVCFPLCDGLLQRCRGSVRRRRSTRTSSRR